MPRILNEIIAHIRMVVANPQISTTLIRTEDLEVLCDAADGNAILRAALKPFADHGAWNDHWGGDVVIHEFIDGSDGEMIKKRLTIDDLRRANSALNGRE